MKISLLINHGFLFIAVLLLSACSTNFATVDESQRDTTGTYDGAWEGVTVKTRSPQQFGDWRAQCADPEIDVVFTINRGKLSLQGEDEVHHAYVDANGRFRVVIPTVHRAQESAASEAGLNSNVKLFIVGNLGSKQPSGKFIVGIAEFAYNGCTSSMTFSRLKPAPVSI